MRLNRARFNRHVRHMGQDASWAPAYRCACWTPETGGADPRCPLCLKRGWVYGEAKATVVGSQQQKSQAQWAQTGMWEEGDVVITVPEDSPMWDGGQYDRVILLNTEEKFSATLTRGGPDDNLSLYSVVSVDRVFWRHPQTQSLVEGGIPTVAEDGALTWSDRAPLPGTKYSITGSRHVEYYVFGNFPSNRNIHQGVRLPKRVVLRRWDVSNRLA